jgi:hypothetical protein
MAMAIPGIGLFSKPNIITVQYLGIITHQTTTMMMHACMHCHFE